MKYLLTIHNEKTWAKDCKQIPINTLKRIITKIQKLKSDPFPDEVHTKQIPHYNGADYRLRVGDYRVLFNRDDDIKEVFLLRVLHRSKLY